MVRKKINGVYSHGDKGWRFQIKDPVSGKWKLIAATKKRFIALNIPIKGNRITKSDAFQLKLKYEELLQQEERYGFPTDEYSLEQAILEYLHFQRNTPEYLRDKERVLNEFRKVIGNLHLREISKGHISTFEKHLRTKRHSGPCKGTKISQTTVARYLRYIRSFFNFCNREGWIYRSPFLNYPMPKDDSSPIEVYSIDEIKGLISWLKEADETESREYIIWYLMGFLGLGLRLIELQELNWENFDRKNRFVIISESKNAESHRSQPIPLCFAHYFKRMSKKSGPMFTTMAGKRTSKNQMQSLRRRITKAFPGFTWQRLRRTYATFLQVAGIDSLIIDRLLGHSSKSSRIRISARHYIGKEYSFYRDLVDKALEPLGEIF